MSARKHKCVKYNVRRWRRTCNAVVVRCIV